MTAIALTTREVDYPESDGRPMAESQVHGQVIHDLLHTLGQRYADVPDVYVWGNLIFYYEEGNSDACVAPDVFLVQGVDKHLRSTYKLWEEGRAPSFVVEVTSKSTRGEDLKTKKDLYERLGVEEYFLFDPLGDYLRPRLQGHRRVGGRYRTLAAVRKDEALRSEVTGLDLVPEGKRLRLRVAATGERLPWADEESRARQAAEERTRALEAELARLRSAG